MTRRRPTPEQRALLVDYYRSRSPRTDNDHRAAAVIAGVTKQLATRAWSRGWPGVPPILEQLAEERAVAAQSSEALRAERIAKVALASASVLHNSVLKIAPVVDALVNRLTACAVAGELSEIDPKAAMLLFRHAARVARDVAAIGERAVAVHRLVNEQATSIVQHLPAPEGPVDLDAAKRDAEALLRAVRREQAKQELTEESDDDVEPGSSSIN